jgi:hypothetical protein
MREGSNPGAGARIGIGGRIGRDVPARGLCVRNLCVRDAPMKNVRRRDMSEWQAVAKKFLSQWH